DLKLMLNLMKPKYLVPIQGEYRMLFAHAKVAQDVGMKKDQIFILGKGEVIEYKNGEMFSSNKVPAGNILIDGIGVGDVGNIVLRHYKLLCHDGNFTVIITINNRLMKIVERSVIISSGFIDVRESEQLRVEVAKIVHTIAEEAISDDGIDC